MKNTYTTIDIDEQPAINTPSKLGTFGAFLATALPGSLVGLPLEYSDKFCNKFTGNNSQTVPMVVVTGGIASLGVSVTAAAITSLVGAVPTAIALSLVGVTSILTGCQERRHMTVRSSIALASIGVGAGAVGLGIGTIGAGFAVTMAVGGVAGVTATYLVNSSMAAIDLVNQRFKRTRYTMDIGESGKTALHYAVISENVDVIKLLLKNPQANAMMSVYDFNEKTAFMLAQESGNDEIINLLSQYNQKTKSVIEDVIDKSAQKVLQNKNGIPKPVIKIISSFAVGEKLEERSR